MAPSLEWVMDKNLTNEQMNEWDKRHTHHNRLQGASHTRWLISL